MSLQSQQTDILFRNVILDLLTTGNTVSTDNVIPAFLAQVPTTDIGSSKFIASSNAIIPYSSSSANVYNFSNQSISRDLTALYRSMFDLSSTAMNNFDRWRTELQKLEAKINVLDTRATELLLISSNTNGYFHSVSDDFVNTSFVNVTNSNIILDLGRQIVTMGATTPGATRINLSTLQDTNVTFTVNTQKNLQGTVDTQGSNLLDPLLNNSGFWQTQVYMTVPGIVVSELTVSFDNPTFISRIDIKLHASNSSSSIQVTPLYTTDGINFNQIPAVNFSQSVLTQATFTFEQISATAIKFLLSKDGYDDITGLTYIYEFGADQIAFYNEGFTEANTETLYSLPWAATDINGNIIPFNKASLEVCEVLSDLTNIKYFLAVDTINTTPLNNLQWVAIDPINRSSPLNPTVINFAKFLNLEIGNSTNSANWVKASYDPAGSTELINPGATFNLDTLASNAVVVTPVTASALRYILPTGYDRILNHQISTTIDLDITSITLLRNLGLKGDVSIVRGIQAGWGFSEPYYNTTIEVKNQNGIDVNFGSQPFLLDGTSQKGLVHIDPGFHSVQVHKNNWVPVGALVSSQDLVELKSKDPLYPYNHKYLIEGYLYPNGYPSIDERIYLGVDTFAEFNMMQVSPFDLLRSVQDSDYTKFALDLDVQDGGRTPSRVFLIKTDAEQPDFRNERFVIRLNTNNNNADLLYNYIWFRADLSANSTSTAPLLDKYSIRLGK